MFARTVLRLGIIGVFAVSLALGAFGCGSSSANQEPATANVKPSSMPEGGEWTGVYYSPVFGYLHLVREGDTATGAWRTAAGDAWGELQGEVDKNLLEYQWTEHKIGMVGAEATKTGKGYFLYVEPKEGEPHQIQGEWGLGEDQTGNPWEAIKQENVKPDPKSVRPDEVEGRMQGGGWE